MTTSQKVGIGLLILAILMWVPVTRSIIVTILPIGSGVDDLVFITALAIGIPLFFIARASEKKGGWFSKQRSLFYAIIVTTIVAVALLYILFS